MSLVEIVAAGVFAILGIRSLVHWLRRPLEAETRGGNALYALFVASRAGLWFALSGLFLVYASVATRGRAFIDDAAEYSWYLVVLGVLAGIQFVSGFFLGRTRGTSSRDGDRGP